MHMGSERKDHVQRMHNDINYSAAERKSL